MSALQMQCLCISREYSKNWQNKKSQKKWNNTLKCCNKHSRHSPTEFHSISQSCPSIWEKPCNKGIDHQISNLEETINRDILRPYRQKCSEDLIFSVRS